jgi:hypothetical protein
MAEHSKLPPSSAHRWWTCSGSPAKTAGIASPDTKYSLEGTAAHEVARICLTEDRDAASLIGQTVAEFKVTKTMAATVQTYLDECRRGDADIRLIEHRIDLEELGPPVPMFGTADYIAYSRRIRELRVIDFKNGSGVHVPGKDNKQLLYYAIGAVLAIKEPVSHVRITVVQPRYAGDDPIRTATIDAVELAEFALELIDRAHATMAPFAPLVAGKHCKFCPAQNSCFAFQNSRVETAWHQFSQIDVHVAGP